MASAVPFKVDTLAAANDGGPNWLGEHNQDLYSFVLTLWSLYLDYAKQMSHPCIAKTGVLEKEAKCVCSTVHITLSKKVARRSVSTAQHVACPSEQYDVKHSSINDWGQIQLKKPHQGSLKGEKKQKKMASLQNVCLKRASDIALEQYCVNKHWIHHIQKRTRKQEGGWLGLVPQLRDSPCVCVKDKESKGVREWVSKRERERGGVRGVGWHRLAFCN